ncbi:unnamed protein product [Didymodactylos carnosus]|uniref:C2H2-type domain-containing protein n=1 Tax=Didymodactylos carnosus TaxID=1234261 RepID=A0A814A6I5_9BILA|nr:unnamed protein product [Didymodactylos carnosus]CAF0909206.1 unnamed protein product [Didymodactylos carnosus]CAF3528448.1 unnamed protein product [Didymodactylos carnosus]CAF3690588.1 unnamed protein product [Didymodactylos carnosus]
MIMLKLSNCALVPLYEKEHAGVPYECDLSPMRDLYYRHELSKKKVANERWKCGFCNKTFYTEQYLDLHFTNRHNNTLFKGEKPVCLADLCHIFRCDVLRQTSSILFSNSLIHKNRRLNEKQLSVLRSKCISLLNQCVPKDLQYDTLMKLQTQMRQAVCSYLTLDRYSELPPYKKSLISFTSVFCLVIIIGMCLVTYGVLTHSDWLCDENQFNSSLPKQKSQVERLPSITPTTISTSNTIVSTKMPSNVRQRVRFKTDNEANHHHDHAHDHHHN